MTLPLVLPPVVGGIALLLLLGRTGLLGQALDAWFGITIPFTTAGRRDRADVRRAAVPRARGRGRAAHRGPAATRPSPRPSARRRSPCSAASRCRSSRPALVAGTVLCFARALGEFGATATVRRQPAGRHPDHAAGDLHGVQRRGRRPRTRPSRCRCMLLARRDRRARAAARLAARSARAMTPARRPPPSARRLRPRRRALGRAGEVLAVLGPNGVGQVDAARGARRAPASRAGTVSARRGVARRPSAEGAACGSGPAERAHRPAQPAPAAVPAPVGARQRGVRPRARGRARAEARRGAADAGSTAVGLDAFAQRRPAAAVRRSAQRVALARRSPRGPRAAARRAARRARRRRPRAGPPRSIAALLDSPGSRSSSPTIRSTPCCSPRGRDRPRGRHSCMQSADGRGARPPAIRFVAALAGVNLVAGTGTADGTVRTRGWIEWHGRRRGCESRPGGADATGVRARRCPGARLHAAVADGEPPSTNPGTGTVATLEPLPGGIRLRTAEHPAIAIDCPSTAAVRTGWRPASVWASRFTQTTSPSVFPHAVSRFRIERRSRGATVDDP